MSHDRKPGRVRVVQAGDRSSRRGRGNGAARGGKAANPGSGGRGQATLIVLFLVASIGAAIAVALQLPS